MALVELESGDMGGEGGEGERVCGCDASSSSIEASSSATAALSSNNGCARSAMGVGCSTLLSSSAFSVCWNEAAVSVAVLCDALTPTASEYGGAG